MNIGRQWLRGWLDLLARDGLPVINSLSPLSRVGVRLRAVGRMLANLRLRLCLWMMLVGVLLARSLCWIYDLSGWQRDALLAAPILFVAPWVVRNHRAHMIRELRRHGRR
ncbi:MAG: hypothetical protein QNJ73_00775 [Gammaproteobacteria bacterium]|nr:hypothetical protein [Gammaproteobacteria bacterium]